MNNSIIIEDLEEIYSRSIPWEKLKEKTVLITGAYGMLASYIMYMLIYLNEKKHMDIKIIVLIRSKEKFYKKFGNKYCKYITIYETLLDTEIKIKEDIDFIIHAASLANSKYYDKYPIEVLLPNVIGNYYLLKLAEQKNIEGYLFFSTGAIYGKLNSKQNTKETDYGSIDTLDKFSCYSESKRMGETMCRAWFKEKNIPIKIVRISHTYGPTMDIKSDPRVFASFVNNVINKEDIIINGTGDEKRSFCYIADAISGYFLVLLSGKNGEAYNVCNTEEFCSIKELAEKLIKIYPNFNLKVNIKGIFKDNIVKNNATHDVPLDNRKLKKLGWKTKYDIENGFKRVIDSNLFNEE